MKPLNQNEAFGKICAFMATIPFYQVLPLIAIERRVASALARNQFIYFEDRQGRPAGYSSWIWLTAEEEESYLQDPIGLTNLHKDKLTENKIKNNRKIWIMDFCGRKTAARKIAAHLKQRLSTEYPELTAAKTVRWSNRHPFPYLHRYSKKAKPQRCDQAGSNPVSRKARLHDVYDLAPHMRWQDREEVRLNSGRNPFEALLNSYKHSRVSNAFELSDKCIGMYGLSDHMKEKDTGMIWLLSNEKLQDYPLYKARVGKKFVSEGFEIYNKLMNYIHEDTQQDTIEWLKFLDFDFTEAIENHNQRGGKFWRFEKSAGSRNP